MRTYDYWRMRRCSLTFGRLSVSNIAAPAAVFAAAGAAWLWAVSYGVGGLLLVLGLEVEGLGGGYLLF